MRSRPFGLSLVLMLTTVAAGLAIRFVHAGLPPFVMKYGGSMLWALMIYWIVSTLLPSRSVTFVAAIACALATAVEFFKLYHVPGLDAFRVTLPGALLLGCFALFAQARQAQSVPSLSAKIDAIFSPLVEGRSPGMAVLVVQNGKKVFERGYGLRDLHGGAKIEAQTEVFE